MQPTKLSIVICTYNRSDLLSNCLESLYDIVEPSSQIEIIVIDNNSSDDTALVASKFVARSPRLKYISESQVGASHARNTAIKKAKSQWVLFLDDDVKVFPDLIDRVNEVIQSTEFHCIGGMQYPWYLEGKPDWMPKGFEERLNMPETMQEVTKVDHFAWGPNMLIRKDVVIELGGFDTTLGPVGTNVGYGEEVELQIRMRKRGYRIAFNPAMKVNHVVRSQKYKLRWHVRAAYAQGKCLGAFFENEYWRFKWFYLIPLRFLESVFIRVPQSIYRLLFVKEYYWQNAVLDSISPIASVIGYTLAQLVRHGYLPQSIFDTNH